MADTAVVFDLDNTLLRTEDLKQDIPVLCAQEFPMVTPQLFTGTYDQYKAEHEGRVNMPEILGKIGERAGLTAPDQKRLLEWPTRIPYRDYLFDPQHSLISTLGPENVFIFTLGDDGYQTVKIAGLGFPPYLAEHGHIRIARRKDSEEIASFIGELRDRGFRNFSFVNDNIVQLWDAYRLAPDDVTPILFQYGPYADEGRLNGKAFPHQTAGEFAKLWYLLSPANMMLESRMMRPIGERK